jgi:hypothetical protein
MKYLLADSGFDLDQIQTWSWRNRPAACANLNHPYRFPIYIPKISSLKNDPVFPDRFEHWPDAIWNLIRSFPICVEYRKYVWATEAQ